MIRPLEGNCFSTRGQERFFLKIKRLRWIKTNMKRSIVAGRKCRPSTRGLEWGVSVSLGPNLGAWETGETLSPT